MNRRRDQPRISLTLILSVIIAATISAAGGVLHAYYKNRQVQLSREIDAIDRRVEHCRLDIRTTEMRMDQLLNRFVIRKQLEDNRSDLRSITVQVVEEVDPARQGRRSVAAATP